MESLTGGRISGRSVLPELAALYGEKGVELRGCEKTVLIITSSLRASEEDWAEEYLAPILSIKWLPDSTRLLNISIITAPSIPNPL